MLSLADGVDDQNQGLGVMSEGTHEFIFIVGSGRCGTTALAQILGSFPGVAYTPELKYFSYAMSSRKRFEPYDSEKAIIKFFIHALEKVLKFNPNLRSRENDVLKNFEMNIQKRSLIGLPPMEIYRFIFYFLVHEFRSCSAAKIVLQTPSNLFFDTLIHNTLGPVKYIFMYRDPRNFFASAMKGTRRWYRKDTMAIVHWNRSMNYGEQLRGKYPNDCLFVNQEDLLLQQNDVLMRLRNFLLLKEIQNGESKGFYANSSFENIPLSASNIERYMYTMDEQEIYHVEFLTRKYLKKYYPQKTFSVYQSSATLSQRIKQAILYLAYLAELTKVNGQVFLRTKGWANVYFILKKIIDRSPISKRVLQR